MNKNMTKFKKHKHMKWGIFKKSINKLDNPYYSIAVANYQFFSNSEYPGRGKIYIEKLIDDTFHFLGNEIDSKQTFFLNHFYWNSNKDSNAFFQMVNTKTDRNFQVEVVIRGKISIIKEIEKTFDLKYEIKSGTGTLSKMDFDNSNIQEETTEIPVEETEHMEDISTTEDIKPDGNIQEETTEIPFEPHRNTKKISFLNKLRLHNIITPKHTNKAPLENTNKHSPSSRTNDSNIMIPESTTKVSLKNNRMICLKHSAKFFGMQDSKSVKEFVGSSYSYKSGKNNEEIYFWTTNEGILTRIDNKQNKTTTVYLYNQNADSFEEKLYQDLTILPDFPKYHFYN